MRAQEALRYVPVDIPPGLTIAQRYLTELFPERPAFRFRHFESYVEVADKLESSQIVFLTPNQLRAFDPTHFFEALYAMRSDAVQYAGESR